MNSQSVNTPLAFRLRPRTWEEFKGQEHLIGQGKPLRRLIEQGDVGSILLWGPPGSGKTTLAYLIARQSNCRLEQISAVSAGVADLRRIVLSAQESIKNSQGQCTILFIDEVHRFNKVQQDAILPYVEDGTVNLIGATTENPYLEVIPALRSRCRIYRLEPLNNVEVSEIVQAALHDPERGLTDCKIGEKALEQIVFQSNGDARFALNALSAAAAAAQGKEIDLPLVEEVLQHAALLYDKAGDEHYDHASAYQKSLRGSDPDAAVYWLGKMIAGGEEPSYIGRRLMVTAAEDVGNADPQALVVAVSAVQAAERLGLPEGRIPLTQATIYVATAPKSNSTVMAIDSALEDIQQKGQAYPVPPHLKDTHYKGAAKMGYGRDYRYPHSFPQHYIPQEYLPPQIKGKVYYKPNSQGFERIIQQRLLSWQKFKKSRSGS